MPKHTEELPDYQLDQATLDKAAERVEKALHGDMPAPAKLTKTEPPLGYHIDKNGKVRKDRAPNKQTTKPADKPAAVKPVAAAPTRKRGKNNASKVAKIDGKSKRLVRLTERIIKAAARIKAARSEFDALIKAQDKLLGGIKS